MVPGHDGPEKSKPRRQPNIFRCAWQEERPQAQLPLWGLLRQTVHQIDEAELFVQRHPWSTISHGEAIDEAKFSVQHDPSNGKARFQLNVETEFPFWKLK